MTEAGFITQTHTSRRGMSMRKLTALGALFLVGFLSVALSAPSADVGLPVPAITAVSEADAAIGRGGGGGEGDGGLVVFDRAGSVLQRAGEAFFFVLIALGLGACAMQRNAGAAIALLVAAFVIGGFLLVPDQVDSVFRSIYQYIL